MEKSKRKKKRWRQLRPHLDVCQPDLQGPTLLLLLNFQLVKKKLYWKKNLLPVKLLRTTIVTNSLQSYKVTETTRKTVTKDKDGNVTEDVSIDKTTTETDSKVQPAGRMARLLKVLPGILMLLILAALAYYVTAKRK